jgi:hypothetical protein
MHRTSKSPRKVTLEALAVARQTLAAYSHRFSPHKFTQHQLFALLVLKTHQQQDYRGVVALLEDMPDLVKALGLSTLPHYTTLQKAAERLLNQPQVQQLLGVTVERFSKNRFRRIDLAAADSTGFDTSRASRYFVKRRKSASKTPELVAYSTFPKLELAWRRQASARWSGVRADQLNGITGEDSYSHHVGGLFNTTGIAGIPTFISNANTTMAGKITGSTGMASAVAAAIDDNHALWDQLKLGEQITLPRITSNKFVGFGFLTYPDLKMAIGGGRPIELTLDQVTVRHTIRTIDVTGAGPVNIEVFEAVGVKVTCKFVDLYDFDGLNRSPLRTDIPWVRQRVDAPFKAGAAVEAGFGTPNSPLGAGGARAAKCTGSKST